MNRRFRINTPDKSSIDIDDEYTFKMWSREFNVTTAKLREVIQAVGNAVVDVRQRINSPAYR